MSAAETQLQKRPGKRIIVSEDLPLTMLTAVASTLVINLAGLDREYVYVGVALSPFVADVIKNAAAGLRKRWLMLLTALLVLFGQTGRAVAARLKARRDWPISWVSIVATTAVSAVLTIAVFTVPELARGQAIFAERGSTFFPMLGAEEPAPIVDVRPPRLVVPSRLVVNSDGPVRVSYTASARDADDSRVTPSCSPQSGAVFPVGRTIVACEAADDAGNRALETFPVIVNDTGSDMETVFTLPEQVRIEASGANGARVGFVATASDQSGKALAVSCKPRSDTVFAIGTTRVTCSATDAAGRRSSGQFAVVVEDQTPPSLTLPDRLPVETGDEKGRRVFFDAIATDAVDGELNPTCEPASGSHFGLGATEVSCRATDARGNRAEGAFTVDVTHHEGTVDGTSPDLRLPSDIRREASSPSGTAITYEAEANDAVDGEVTVRCEPASGSTFGLSTTTVRCSARDSSGNKTEDTFVVTVSDTTAPRLRLPRPVTAEATSSAGAIVQYQATARDVVNGARAVDCSPAPGSTFPLQRTTVRCTARDSSGNRASESFPVTVVDTTAPDLTLPDDLTVEATSADGATVPFEAGAKDAVSGRLTPVCTPPPGAFGFGKTVVTCTAADGQGNRSTRTFSISVVDRLGPDIGPLKDLAVEATSKRGAHVDYDVRAVDAVSGQVEAVCAPRPGLFRMGPTTVTCTAADARGNTSTGQFVVKVVDTAPPALGLPDDFVLYGWLGEAVEFVYSASATDRIDGALEPSCTPPPGTLHVVRAWEEKVTVECAAADRSGNKATGGFVITVRRIYIG